MNLEEDVVWLFKLGKAFSEEDINPLIIVGL